MDHSPNSNTVNNLNDSDTANETNSLNTSASISDRRKTNESKRKDTGVSKALANLKADREKKKQQGNLFLIDKHTQIYD